MRFKTVKELWKVREPLLLKSLLASSSCVITIIESSVNDEVFDLIHMVNDFKVHRKHLLLLTPTFNATNLKNLTINYDVTIVHSNGGKFQIMPRLMQNTIDRTSPSCDR